MFLLGTQSQVHRRGAAQKKSPCNLANLKDRMSAMLWLLTTKKALDFTQYHSPHKDQQIEDHPHPNKNLHMAWKGGGSYAIFWGVRMPYFL